MTEGEELAGRHVLVTGAGRGIGAEIARTLAAAGARVTLIARTASDVQAVATMIGRAGGDAVAIAADVNDVSALGPLIGDAVARGGGLMPLRPELGMLRCALRALAVVGSSR